MSEKPKLGELGGFWEVLFKIRQISGVAMVPLVIALITVVVVPWCKGMQTMVEALEYSDNQMNGRLLLLEDFASKGDRFTASMATAMKLELQNDWLKEVSEIRRQIDTLPQTLQIPPVWWDNTFERS